jgi:hypothetical protein
VTDGGKTGEPGGEPGEFGTDGHLSDFSNASTARHRGVECSVRVAQVQQGGALSNSLTFTVNTVTVSSFSPTTPVAPGVPVTINGSGFGALQGTGQVMLGSAYGVVQSWSDTQIVAKVASNSTTGNVQVLQNGVWSPAIQFTVDALQILSISPAFGVPGDAVTFTGSGFGTVPGTVVLGSKAGIVSGWSDTQVTATVALGATSGIAQVQTSGGASNAVGFKVTGSGTVVPAMLNMVVGDSHTIQALDANGNPLTGLTWASSNSNIVSLSTDDPPILTAVAVGKATITATNAAGTQFGSCSVTVTLSLSLGSVLWTNPGDGSGVTNIVPAVPSPSGVADVFAFQNDGTVAAITSDGVTAWTTNIGNSAYALPDFQGGLAVIANGGTQIYKLDGMTGQPYSAYTGPGPSVYTAAFCDGSCADTVVHPDGTIFSIQGGDDDGNPPQVVGIDPTTGTQKFSVPTDTSPPGWGGTVDYGIVIAGDGYAYTSYAYQDGAGNMHLRLLQVDTSGASNKIEVREWAPGTSIDIGEGDMRVDMITNADQGVLISWEAPVFSPSSLSTTWDRNMAITTGTSFSIINGSVVPGQQSDLVPVLQAQDGSFVGIARPSGWAPSMVSFDQTGNVRWVVPNDQPQIATADGGVIGQSGITYDANGNATGMIANLPTYSWLGYAYQDGPIDFILTLPIDVAKAYWALSGGNASANNTATLQQPYAQLADCNDPNLHPSIACPGPKNAIFDAWYWLQQRIADPTRAAYLDYYVFKDTTGSSRRAFAQYLGLGAGPQFYDRGSTVRLSDAVCAGPDGWTVNHFFDLQNGPENGTGTCGTSAITCRFDQTKPMRTFFEPRAVSLDNQGATDANVALLFHEALHGFTSKNDEQLQSFLGCTPGDDTRDITIYLQQFIGAQSPPATPNSCKFIDANQMPGTSNVCVR